jgi:hypothetical protein
MPKLNYTWKEVQRKLNACGRHGEYIINSELLRDKLDEKVDIDYVFVWCEKKHVYKLDIDYFMRIGRHCPKCDEDDIRAYKEFSN